MWTDALGNRHARALDDFRIVSLVPSITELLVDLDLGHRLVGRTGFCLHPREALARVPKVGGTKDIDLSLLHALKPTHAIVSIDENTQPGVEALREFVPNVIVTHPLCPEDNLLLYRLLGGIFDREMLARTWAESLQRELIACRARAWPPERVLYLIWRDPWMTVAADTYIARMLELVGWNVIHSPGGERGAQRYPVIDDLRHEAARAQRVLLSSEPYPFRAQQVAELRAHLPGMPIDLVDGAMTSWYGSRAVAALGYLRSLRSATVAADHACQALSQADERMADGWDAQPA